MQRDYCDGNHDPSDAARASAIAIEVCEHRYAFIRLYDKDGRVFAIACLDVAEAAITFGQAQAACHEIAYGVEGVAAEVGHA